MKKIVLSTFVILTCLAFVNAQEIADNAIGLRIGSNDGFGTEVTYQRALGGNNRLEVDLGWRSGNNSDGFKLASLYQWVWQLEGNFNWYAGAGGGLGTYSYDNNRGDEFNETFAFIAGNIGIEYGFDFPLLLSLDFRPELSFGDFNDDLDFDLALGIRYQF